jgi:ATP-dependent exoDNAse (exonuclease V) beta subunit
MANSLDELLKENESKKHATNTGNLLHKKLRLIRVLSDCVKVDSELKNHLESCDGLPVFFTENAQTEVPVAGIINGHFISRRIDRLLVDDNNKIVRIMDYKTDVDKELRRDKYVAQLGEYAKLLKQIYPKYKIEKYNLWLHDWALEKI